jgi:hypothetical protein
MDNPLMTELDKKIAEGEGYEVKTLELLDTIRGHLQLMRSFRDLLTDLEINQVTAEGRLDKIRFDS